MEIIDLKNTILIKYHCDGLMNRVKMTENTIGELEDIAVEFTNKRRNRLKKYRHNIRCL